VLAGLQFNMDEMMAAWAAARKGNGFRMKVYLPKSMKRNAYRLIQNGDTMHVTVLLCTCADGSHVDHTLVLPRVFFPHEMTAEAGHFNWAGIVLGIGSGTIWSGLVRGRDLVVSVSGGSGQAEIW
jgi:hypothetical protein